LGVLTRAVRNISRRKIRSLLVIIALSFSLAIMISIPAGVVANQSSTLSLAQNLGNTITATEASINQTLTQIDCSLTPEFEGFGFRQSDSVGPGNFTPGQPPPGNFTPGDPGEFGGGRDIPGQFGGGAFGQGGSIAMNQTLYEDISSISGVAAVAPVLQVSEGQNVTMEMMGRSFTRLVTEYVIEGVSLTSDLEGYPILPTNIAAGRNLQAGDTGVVLLSENNTEYFGVDVGDTVTILGETFEVIGTHGSSGVTTTLYMSLSDAQSLTNNTGYITSLSVFAESSDVVTEVADSVSSLHPELSVVTSQQRLSQIETMQQTYQTTLDNAEASLATMQTTALGEIVVAVAATSLIVFFVMLYTVRERTKEIGTLKAIGFSNKTVMSQFVLEGMLLSLIAGVVGIVIGSVAAPVLSGFLLPAASQLGIGGTGGRLISGTNLNMLSTAATVTLTPELVLLGLGGAVLLGVLGSLYPAWRASRTRPAEAMRYE
jgi:putative ABC transport system permease protein